MNKKLESAAQKWIALKAQEKEIEAQKKELKELIQPFLEKQEGKSAELAGWKFSLVEFEKESFSISKAREKISEKVLSPFISKCDVVQIRTSWQGGEEAA